MTRLNPAYYNPTIDAESSLRYQAFDSLPQESAFDLTGSYARCGGQYSPICNRGIVYGGDLTYTNVSPTRHYDMRSLNMSCGVSTAPLFLTNGTCGGNSAGILSPVKYDNAGKCLGSVSSRNTHTAAASYKKWWLPTGAPSLYDTEIFLGWCYKNVIISDITVVAWSSDLSTTVSSDYEQHDYSAYPHITAIYGNIYVGGVGELENIVKRRKNREVNGITVDPMIGSFFDAALPVQFAEWTLPQPDSPQLVIHNKSGTYTSCYNLCASKYLFNAGYVGCTTVGTTWTENDVPFDTRAQSGRLVGLYSLLTSGQSASDVENNQHKYYIANASKDLVRKIIATYGLYFGGSGTTVTGSQATSQYLHCPVPDSDGVFRGNYVSGTDIATAPNADWGGDATSPYIWWDGATTGVKKIYKGSSQGQGFFLGDTALDKLYLGDTLLFSVGTEPEPPTPSPTSGNASVVGLPEDADATPTVIEAYSPIIGEPIPQYTGVYASIVGTPQLI